MPPLLKWQLETRGSQLLGRELRVGQVQFSPHTLTLTLRDLSMASASGDAPQLQVERLFVDLDARSLLRLAPVIAALEIDAPRLKLARLADGRYDIDDLLQRFAPQPDAQPSEPARFALFNLRVAGGEVSLDDRPVGRTHELRKIVLDLPFLSNLPDDLQVKVEPRLAFELNGSAFDNHGRSTPFAEGRASEFDIRIDALDLAPMWAYLPATLPVQPRGGRLSAELKLQFEQPQGSEPRLQLKGQLELRDMQIQPPGDAPLLAWQSLRVQLADLRPLQRRVVLDAVALDGLVLHVRRDAEGRLELERLASAALSAGPAPTPTSATAPAWQLQLDVLDVKAAQIHWSDAVPQPAAELQLDGIVLQLKQLRWPFETDAALSLDAQLKSQGKAHGRLHAEGGFTDRQAKLGLQLADIDLALAEPYLRQFLRLQASARLQGDATLDWAQGDAPRLNVGLSTLRIDDVRLSEPRARAPVLQLARLELAELQADLLQRRVAVGAISLQRPFIELSRDAQGAVNASSWVMAEAGTASAPAPADAGPPWQLTLREFKLDGGRARLADAALAAGPLEVDGLRLQVQDLAWPDTKPVNTQLSASLAVARKAEGAVAAAPSRLDWRGRIAPQPLGVNGQLRVERFPVHVFEPYFARACRCCCSGWRRASRARSSCSNCLRACPARCAAMRCWPTCVCWRARAPLWPARSC